MYSETFEENDQPLPFFLLYHLITTLYCYIYISLSLFLSVRTWTRVEEKNCEKIPKKLHLMNGGSPSKSIFAEFENWILIFTRGSEWREDTTREKYLPSITRFSDRWNGDESCTGVRSWQGVELARLDSSKLIVEEGFLLILFSVFLNFKIQIVSLLFFFFQFGGSFRLIVRKESWFWIFFFSEWFKIFWICLFSRKNFHNSGGRISSRGTPFGFCRFYFTFGNVFKF